MKFDYKQTVSLLGLLGIVGLSGCVVAIGSGKHSSHPPPPALAVTDCADAANMAEIDAAGKLNFDNARTHALAQIAQRSALSARVQVHLVNVAYRSLDFENNKVEVLSKVISRPDFCDATRHAIVSQLNKLNMDNNKQRVLQQVNDRLTTSGAR